MFFLTVFVLVNALPLNKQDPRSIHAVLVSAVPSNDDRFGLNYAAEVYTLFLKFVL